MFPEQGSRMQTPFYVTKRTVVTKETALALFNELLNNDDPTRKNASDLIDFCLSGPKEEKVFLSLGGKVRLKENDGWQHCGLSMGASSCSSTPKTITTPYTRATWTSRITSNSSDVK